MCHLRKSLYGLKQAPRAWYKRFADYVYSIGFSQSKSDNFLFIYRKDTHMAYLLYVDDIILTTSSDDLRKSIISRLSSEFSMKDLGRLTSMSSCKSCPTPVDTKPKLNSNANTPYEDPSLYRSLVGALQYLTFTRPDISYAVQQICLFMHDPVDDHMQALQRILRYIRDADWGGCPDTRRSTSGYCVFLGDNLLSWSSKRQPTLSWSSSEAEYRGVANVVSDSCWLRNLLLELHCLIHKATVVYCDNVSAMYKTY
ncbi:hypothetical protein L195_g020039 [Trifolium pratense]|uniref:Reverse transcriptase Ty1/copia-type domain-containing protein n=1 Tax=Trifolium pratense TaxID=57577 RepID=A0A2K3N192_TRIPR|nr:hypothetical protein L195_g020039 [Trifolium pratense]